MKYILILWMVTGPSYIHSVEFFNKDSCVVALESIKNKTAGNILGTCESK